MPARGFTNWKSNEFEYRFSLKLQIDKIAELFSTRLETTSANIAAGQQIMLDTAISAIGAMEAMLSPFEDKEYKAAIGELKALPAEGIKARHEWALKKFALLIKLMKRKRMLPEETTEEIEVPAIEEGVSSETPIA
jgi:hypothetical protein